MDTRDRDLRPTAFLRERRRSASHRMATHPRYPSGGKLTALLGEHQKHGGEVKNFKLPIAKNLPLVKVMT